MSSQPDLNPVLERRRMPPMLPTVGNTVQSPVQVPSAESLRLPSLRGRYSTVAPFGLSIFSDVRSTQAPLLQVRLVAHCVPHAPQFALSRETSDSQPFADAPSQSMKPGW